MRFILIKKRRLFEPIFFCLLATLLVSQLLLAIPKTRPALSYVESKETFLEAPSKVGELTLELNGIAPDPNICVMQNGIVLARFEQAVVSVPVQDNSVIEIDGCAAKQNFFVLVRNKTDNISTKLPERIEVCSNISMLGRIFVK